METKKPRSFADVTAIVKMFLRDEYSMECIRSLMRNFPSIRIIALDDGHHTEEKDGFFHENRIRYVKTPFDIGLGHARNVLSRLVETEYVLVGDDDFYYTPDCGIKNLLRLMDVADIACGRVSEDGAFNDYQCLIRRTDDGGMKWSKADAQWLVHDGIPYMQADVAYNFYIAKSAKIRGMWDDAIKVAYEHSDFFLTAKAQGIKAVFTPYSTVIHKPPHVRNDFPEYSDFRRRRSDKEHFFRKWGADWYEDMKGNRDDATYLHEKYEQ